MSHPEGPEAVIDDGAPVSTALLAEGRARVAHARALVLLTKYGVLLAMVLTFVAFSLAKTDAFLSVITVKAIVRDMAPMLVIALGVTVVLVMNDFDLALGSLAGLSGTTAVMIVSAKYFGLPVPLAVVLVLLAGVAIGLINGWLVAVIGAGSFIITLASGTFIHGLDLTILHSRTIFEGIPDSYVAIAGTSIAGISSQTLIGLFVFVVIWVLLGRTEAGRHMYAVGGNFEAARLSGIRATLLRVAGFMIVGACAAVAGILISSQAGAANPNSGQGLFLPAYAAAFLGTTMWSMGAFTPVGTLLGVLFLQIITTGLSMFNLAGSLVLVIQGGILVIAVVLSRFARLVKPQ